MNKVKLVFLIIYLLIAAYGIVASLARAVTPGSNWCSIKVVNDLAPWTSGCFYSSYYSDEEVSEKQLISEVARLEEFDSRGGMAADIHLYRLLLHIKYQPRLKTNFQEIHKLYRNYTKSEHYNIKIQAEYLSFIHTSDLKQLAQTTLDDYCSTYVFKGKEGIVDEFKLRLARFEVPLNLSGCYEIATGVVN